MKYFFRCPDCGKEIPEKYVKKPTFFQYRGDYYGQCPNCKYCGKIRRIMQPIYASNHRGRVKWSAR